MLVYLPLLTPIAMGSKLIFKLEKGLTMLLIRIWWNGTDGWTVDVDIRIKTSWRVDATTQWAANSFSNCSQLSMSICLCKYPSQLVAKSFSNLFFFCYSFANICVTFFYFSFCWKPPMIFSFLLVPCGVIRIQPSICVFKQCQQFFDQFWQFWFGLQEIFRTRGFIRCHLGSRRFSELADLLVVMAKQMSCVCIVFHTSDRKIFRICLLLWRVTLEAYLDEFSKLNGES